MLHPPSESGLGLCVFKNGGGVRVRWKVDPYALEFEKKKPQRPYITKGGPEQSDYVLIWGAS